jgi:hypothetical protein
MSGLRHLLHNSQRYRQRLITHAHEPEKIWVETQTNEAPVLERNTEIRNAGLLKQGARNPFADGDEIVVAFQFPTLIDYRLARAKYPDLFLQAERGGHLGIQAGERLALLFPGYVTTIRRGDRLGGRYAMRQEEGQRQGPAPTVQVDKK